MVHYTVERARDFGTVLAVRRDEIGISQEDLAERLGFPRSYLSELESGRSTLQLERLFRALHALGVDVEVSWSATSATGDDSGG